MNREEWSPVLEEDAYQEALAKAWGALEGKDLAVRAKHAGAIYVDGVITLRTFGRDCVIDPAKRRMTVDGKDVKPLAAILVLHYLANAGQTKPTGKTISYRQLPGGNIHYSAFRTRAVEPIGEMFHHQPQMLLSSMKALGAKKLEHGEASILIDVFPKLPVTVIVWKGDDEVRGTANVLFDETAPQFLSTEDLAAVGTFVMSQLIKARTDMLREINDVNTL